MSADQSTTTRPVEYRIIAGFPDYRVGDDGSVWSKRRGGEWRKMTPGPRNHDGHVGVTLFPGGKSRYVHHLVLEAFVGPCPPEMLARHGDGDPKNNALWNLRWGTHGENMADAVAHGTTAKGERNKAAKLTDEQVRAIRAEYTGRHGQQGELACKYGVTAARINHIVNGKAWTHVS